MVLEWLQDQMKTDADKDISQCNVRCMLVEKDRVNVKGHNIDTMICFITS